MGQGVLIQQVPPKGKEEVRFEDGEGGFACVSRVDGECWIHELEGSGMNGVALMARARRQAAEWGFEKVGAPMINVKLALALQDHGWKIKGAIMEGKTRGGKDAS